MGVVEYQGAKGRELEPTVRRYTDLIQGPQSEVADLATTALTLEKNDLEVGFSSQLVWVSHSMSPFSQIALCRSHSQYYY